MTAARHFLALAGIGMALAGCHETVGEREESLGPGLHRVTVDLQGDGPAEARLNKNAQALCPAGFRVQGDETVPPDSPTYRVWLVRCK
ncbi:MAG TPA: hypothetical protein VGV37_10760 [Aliidongia sp.]|uniref:hypothetical protein n=1 Tax=Aliidongia sp. TaxID=1914230 RepID=UPI002DDD9D90|nr:hypothetical protein [Aliidongia sp.]HEV2675011.1 hypothetical protein [Aliidongia sp.]